MLPACAGRSLNWSFNVTSTLGVRNRVEQAAVLPEILDAAHDAFGAMLAVIGRYEDSDGDFFAALVMAAATAADGRDAVAAAPSLPAGAGSGRPAEPAPDKGAAESSLRSGDVAAELVALSDAVALRLQLAAPVAVRAEDRAACRDGADYAREVSSLLAGTRP
jgi:hypothetical protein